MKEKKKNALWITVKKNLSFSIFCTSYNLSRYLAIDMKLIVLGSFPPIRQPPRSQKKKKKKKTLILIAYAGNLGKLIDNNHCQVEITRVMVDWN